MSTWLWPVRSLQVGRDTRVVQAVLPHPPSHRRISNVSPHRVRLVAFHFIILQFPLTTGNVTFCLLHFLPVLIIAHSAYNTFTFIGPI